ncbi:hypothetical protein NIES4071_86900 [Calothrix sp. NIES-4071]|nr:hypothetical protein NIES4071_86900 [Calothrix sp. NIES-4071]BAZ62957.1 hypothetical protein NIES4105_86830 [Calothrix sp. NIES-4105]
MTLLHFYPLPLFSLFPFCERSDLKKFFETSKSLVSYTGFSLAELAHLIEKAEREIFIRANGAITTKEYRHNQLLERSKVVAEVETAWNQVKSIGAPINLTINDHTTDAALNRFKTYLLDGYDLFILETMSTESIRNIITDDGDFVTIPGIEVFTCNLNAINAAQAQGKLVVRS